ASRRNPAGENCRCREENANSGIDHGIDWFDLEEKTSQHTRQRQCAREADDQSKPEEPRALTQNQSADVAARCAERETQAEFGQALEGSISEKSVQPNGGERQREAGENGEEKTEQTLRAPCFLHTIEHRPHVEDRLRWIDRANNIADRFFERD